jgi:RecA/RadA recombinase
MHANIPKTIFKGVLQMKKTNLSIHAIEKSDFQIAKEILKPDIVVLSGIKELDNLLGGFKQREITYIDGDSSLISKIADQICVNTYRTFQSATIYIDAGMCADPYRVAQYARNIEVNQKEVLEHVHLSRAFTVYQLATLIQDLLEQAIRRYKPQTLIISRLPVFYLDSDVETKEAQTLLRTNLHKIKELTTKYNLITIFTNLDRKMMSNNRGVRKIIHNNVSEVVFMKESELATKVELLNKREDTVILHLSKGQLRLQEFGMVM